MRFTRRTMLATHRFFPGLAAATGAGGPAARRVDSGCGDGRATTRRKNIAAALEAIGRSDRARAGGRRSTWSSSPISVSTTNQLAATPRETRSHGIPWITWSRASKDG